MMDEIRKRACELVADASRAGISVEVTIWPVGEPDHPDEATWHPFTVIQGGKAEETVDG